MADRGIKKISQIENMQDLANYVGVTLNLLTFFAYADKNFYYSFSIPKKNGAVRAIDAPNKPLKQFNANWPEDLPRCIGLLVPFLALWKIEASLLMLPAMSIKASL